MAPPFPEVAPAHAPGGQPARRAARPLTVGAFVLILGFGGFASSLQARVNGELTRHTGSGVLAALINFAMGFVLISIVVWATPAMRRGVRQIGTSVRAGTLPWWALTAGFLGGGFVACQSYSTALIGVSLFAVSMVSGQTVNSLVVDRIGLGPVGRIPLTARRVIAAGMAVLAVGVANLGALQGTPIVVSAVAIGLLGGALVAVQQAFNGRVNASAGQPLATAWTSFLAGTLGLGLGVLVSGALVDTGMHAPTSGPWWMYTGGALGATFVACTAWAVPRYGVLVVALVVIAGQLTMALALDLLAPIGSARVTIWLALGVVLTFAAVGIGALVRKQR